MSCYIVDGLRTPIGKTGGILKDFLPEHLAAAVFTALLERNNLPAESIDQVAMGNVVGPGGNIARLSVLEAGFPYSTPAFTIDAQCGSSLTALGLAQALIASGQADLVIAGGVESTSLAPRRRFHENDPRFTGAADYYEQAPFSPPHIGNPSTLQGAERLAEAFAISRAALDEVALSSHKKAAAARKFLTSAILPLVKNEKTIQDDQCIRADISPRLLSRMPGLLSPDSLTTAGNSCLRHDGAAALLLASEKARHRYALRPRAKALASASTGCDPNHFPLGPVYAIRELLEKQNLSLEEIDAVEINEAFAVKILACCQELSLPLDKVNRLGGALAYGHPYGASGAMITLHLLRTLEQEQMRLGIAAAGAVGGLGTALLLEVI